MLRLAGRFADICYIPPWTKMPREDAKELILTEARRFNREDKVKFAYSFEGPTTPKYDYRAYLEKVEEAKQNGCDYFMVPFNYGSEMPWLLSGAESKSKSEKCLEPIRHFAKNVIPSFTR